jgi:osmoprotectant transport system permease protein
MTADRDFLLDPANWVLGSPTGIPHRIVEHLGYCGIALLVAAVVAIPVGLAIGHTGRGAFLVISIGNAWRALPTFGLLSLLVALIGVGPIPALAALVVLAIPPLLLATYSGVQAVDPGTVDAARGMGLREVQVLSHVEVPIALPLVIGGLRSAALQVVSTATIAAYVGLGGLGRLLVDGLALGEYDQVVAGAVVVAGLAIAVDLALAAVQRYAVSPGLTSTPSRGQPARTSTSPPPATVPNPSA